MSLADTRDMTKTATATVEVITTDATWIAAHTTGQVEERVSLPGCTVTGRFTFCGREWVNYRLPAGVKAPRDWDKGVENALAAPAQWVH
jgi:hypothetical protein